MKVTVVGTGYVGLVQGVCLAEVGHNVVCIDIDEVKIENLKKGVSPIYEPGIEELIAKNMEAGRLSFDTDLAKYLNESDVNFIAVGTPSDEDGRADLSVVFAVAEEIGKNLTGYTIIATKSTVPMGTNREIMKRISANYDGEFDVISNPEFLREGLAIDDFLNPDRVVLGYDKNRGAAEKVAELYAPLNTEVLITDLETAEMIKYAANAFLATEISYINSIARLCEKVGADVEAVSEGLKLDKRIGKKAFLSAGLGYGGSCFPKDVRALIRIARDYDTKNTLLEVVEEVNLGQRQYFVMKIREKLGDLKGKKIAILGMSFKPDTDDMREAPAINIVEGLSSLGVDLVAYDPVAEKNAKRIFPELVFAESIEKACNGADAVAIITDWAEFKDIDWVSIINKMKNPLVFDGRNMFNLEKMREMNIDYFPIGR
ncbi:MAG: UDP-glucose/GDP-mannose dehydrogenase family protein [Minisyncoccus archaeiphilus]|uniref:UDP-glucose dehydrogenase family protein n=1 Tax=Minisyncoccus archaeiphilus TaxID=3238481 RepID=UPI002B145D41|nr:MAG: UDP-glucose/GDP-mannose dehydrogenase family protein [Candidatus Parcubacteria bacterium]